MDRRARILELIDVDRELGIELGPLHAPIVERTDRSVYYVDHLDTEVLRWRYRDDPSVAEIPEVDIVLGGRRVAEAVAAIAPVDYIVASHVIEHVPDMIGWLADLAAALRPGGILSLAVPDKRYSFDVRRRCTELSELVDAYLNRRRCPSIGQIFDFHAKTAFSVTTADLWAGDDAYLRLADDDAGALGMSREAHEDPGALEVHCTVFTDASFLDLLERLFTLDLVPAYEVAAFYPVERGSVEFHIALRRLPDGIDPDERRARQLASLPSPIEIPALLLGNISRSEVRLIETKRRAMTALRNLPGARAAEAWMRRRSS